MKRLFAIMALCAIAALSVAACGSGAVGDAITEQCIQEAQRIQDPAARAAAEEGCRAAEDGALDEADAKAAARRRCLRATDRIANEQARQDARRRCNEVR